MPTATKTIYRSKIDWWLWLIWTITLAIIILTAIDMSLWYPLITGGGMSILYAFLILGCWYEIDGNDLVVYQFFKPTRMPISKIKDVKKTTGYLATAGMSHLRVSISFSDRSVLKSYAPLEISPKNRDGFISHLKTINPDIITS